MDLLLKRTTAKNFKNYRGQTINGWKILELHSAGAGVSRWLCRHLKCGSEKIMRISRLKEGGQGRKAICKCESHQEAKALRDQVKERNYSEDERLRDQLRKMNGPGRNLAAPPASLAPENRKKRRNFTPAEIGMMQAESYAKALICRVG